MVYERSHSQFLNLYLLVNVLLSSFTLRNWCLFFYFDLKRFSGHFIINGIHLNSINNLTLFKLFLMRKKVTEESFTLQIKKEKRHFHMPYFKHPERRDLHWYIIFAFKFRFFCSIRNNSYIYLIRPLNKFIYVIYFYYYYRLYWHTILRIQSTN